MPIGKLWAGRVFGTNVGNLFLKLQGDDQSLTGTLHISDKDHGVNVFSVHGNYDGNRLVLAGLTDTQFAEKDIFYGQLSVVLTPDAKGEFRGQWKFENGAAGTLVLYPHDEASTTEIVHAQLPDQLNTARYTFRAVQLMREQIIDIANQIQNDFKNDVVVTIIDGTEQSRFLPAFKAFKFLKSRVEVVKIFVQEQENSGLNRVVQVEFGPQINFSMTQGSDEAWVLGMLEKIKRAIRPYELRYSTNIKNAGIGINQLLFFGAIIWLPSFERLQDRTILMLGVISLAFGVNFLHNSYLPMASLYLGDNPKGVFSSFFPSILSWIIAVSAGVAAALLGAYLQGWLGLG
jgi:hypothetical protein